MTIARSALVAPVGKLEAGVNPLSKGNAKKSAFPVATVTSLGV